MTLFELFLPLQNESRVANKYWGGVYRIVSQILFHEDLGVLHVRLQQIKELAEQVKEISETLSEGHAPWPDRLPVPSHMYQAFISIIIFMTGFQPKNDLQQSFHRYIKDCSNKLNRGMKHLTETFSCDLANTEAILPAGVMGLLVYRLHQDITNSEPDIIRKAYTKRLNDMEKSIALDHRSREHQKDLVYVRQELSVIIKIITEQKVILETVRRALGPGGTARTSSALNSGESRGISVIARTWSEVRARLQEFEALSRRVEDLSHDHERLIAKTKDTMEAASLTFAIVSVIFLPLTTVASILGMNTNDIRNMDQTQWVFWSAGIPVALFTAMLCLWVTSQLSEFKHWIGKQIRSLLRFLLRPITNRLLRWIESRARKRELAGAKRRRRRRSRRSYHSRASERYSGDSDYEYSDSSSRV